MKNRDGSLRRWTSLALFGAAMTMGSMVTAAHMSAARAEPAVLEVEESDVATLPPVSPHWVMVSPPFSTGAARLFDGDSGKMLGSLHVASLGVPQFDPMGRFIYVSETIWSKGNRGTRQDMLTVYDAKTFKLVTEIPLPGRLLTGEHKYLMDISADGKRAYIYTMVPASEIIVVDLVKRKVVQSVEVAGCGMAYASGNDKVASLCGDGTLTTVDLGHGAPKVTQSKPFFDADADPVFDNAAVDTKTGKAVFLTYSGLVYQTTIDGSSPIEAPWSLQEAAHMNKGETVPLKVNWFPGGRQLMGYNAATNRLYVLMHMGEFWTQKENGTELWEVDLATHKILRRHELDKPVRALWVSPDAKPQIYLVTGNELEVLDAADFSTVHKFEDVSFGLVTGPAAK